MAPAPTNRVFMAFPFSLNWLGWDKSHIRIRNVVYLKLTILSKAKSGSLFHKGPELPPLKKKKGSRSLLITTWKIVSWEEIEKSLFQEETWMEGFGESLEQDGGWIVLAIFWKLFENAKNTYSKRWKVLLARMVGWFGDIYTKGFFKDIINDIGLYGSHLISTLNT